MISFKGHGTVEKVLKVTGDFEIRLSAFDWHVEHMSNGEEISRELNAIIKQGLIDMKTKDEILTQLNSRISRIENSDYSGIHRQKTGILDRLFR